MTDERHRHRNDHRPTDDQQYGSEREYEPPTDRLEWAGDFRVDAGYRYDEGCFYIVTHPTFQ
jgi:hypothetical protein